MNKLTSPRPNTEARKQTACTKSSSVAAQMDATALLGFLKSVTRTLNKGSEQNASLTSALQEIARFVGWPVGHVYLVNPEANALEPTDAWYFEDTATFQAFQDITAETKFARGVGMPGRVWETATPEWMANVTPGPMYPRAERAFESGLVAGFGFPLTAGETVVGVAEFFATTDTPPDPEFLDCLSVIGSRLGRMVQLYQSQNMVARHAQLMDHVDEIIAVTDPSGFIIDCNTSFETTFGYPKEKIIGMRTGDFAAHEEDIEIKRQSAFQALEEVGHWRGELAFQTADKAVRIFDVSSVTFKDPVTNKDGLILSGRDITARKAAEEALRKNENRLARAIETYDAGIFDRDFETDTTFMSASMKQISGYGEALSDDRRKWLDLVLPEDRDISKHAFGALKRGEQDRFDIEYRISTATGAIRWIRSRGMAVKNESGKTVRAVGMLQDITDAKNALDAMRLSNAAVEATDGAIIIADATVPGRDIVYVNPAFEQMMGYDRAEVIGKSPADIFRVAGKDPEVQKLEVAEKTGQSIEMTLKTERKDGTPFTRHVAVSPIKDQNGQVTHLVSVSKDVTEDREREDLLNQQATVLQTMADGLTVTNRDGFLIDCNPAYEAMTGCSRSEIIGKRPRDFRVVKDDEHDPTNDIETAILAGDVWQGELRVRRQDGEIIVVESHATSIRDDQGEFISGVTVSRDVTARRKMEDSLAHQTAALNNIKEAMLIQNQDGIIVDCNEGAQDLYGYTQRELIGMNSRELVSPALDTDALYEDVVPRILANGYWSGELEIKRKDGLIRQIEVSSTLLRDRNGDVKGWVELNRDITERKRIQNAQRLHSLVMEQLDETVVILNLDSEVIDCNAKAEGMLGYSREELLGQPAIAMMAAGSEEERELFRRYLLDELHKHGLVQFENKIRRKNGEVRDVHVTYGTLLDENGVEFGRVVVANDITDAKQAQEDIEAGRQRVEAVIAASGAGIWEADVTKGQTHIGPVLKTLSGYGDSFADDIREWRNLVHPDDLHIYDSRFENWQGKKRPVDAEYRIIAKNGEIRWVRSRGEMSGNEQGEMVHGIGLGWDITEEKQKELRQEDLEQRLLQAQKMETLGTLTGGIAHDFNNILTPILGYAHLARTDCKDQDEVQTHLERIIGGAERAKELVRRILTFSRHIEPAQTQVDIQNIAREVFSLISASAPPQIEVKVTADGQDEKAMADSVQIHQALMNLCTNGLQAMGEGPGVLSMDVKKVELSIEECETKGLTIPAGSYINVNVQDTGSGIDPEIVDRVYEPFFTTRELDEGTGLGLSMVHGIVEAHKGAIRLDTNPNSGTRFEVYLPALPCTP